MNPKLHFLQHDFLTLLQTLEPAAKGKWGVMNGQQMVEHMSDSVRIANGKDPKRVILTPEQMEKARGFMLTDKPFKENTKNIELPEIPPPVTQPSMQAALSELKEEIGTFVKVFENQSGKIITNPFFGDLDFEQWTHLLHKHATHHLRQFGLIE